VGRAQKCREWEDGRRRERGRAGRRRRGKGGVKKSRRAEEEDESGTMAHRVFLPAAGKTRLDGFHAEIRRTVLLPFELFLSYVIQHWSVLFIALFT
jgi:hypothetical protein